MSNSNGAKADLPEIWKEIKAKGVVYEISNHGRIRRYMKPFKTVNSKYLQVGIPGRGPVFVHTLVMELFIGPRPKGRVTNHKDGDGLNNREDNLEYITQQQNCQHAVDMGLHKYGVGEKSTRWKVGDAEAQKIIDRYEAGGISQRQLAALYGLTVGCVRYIVTYRKGLSRGK